MSDITATPNSAMSRFWRRLDPAWAAIAVILGLVAALTPGQFPGIVSDTLRALLNTAPFILFAVCAVAYLKATDAESLIARAFEGSQTRMIILAALFGGLSPFCSCEIIPFIAAMLALGVPIAAVMALWLSSPLMDPAMFTITAAGLGMEFAIAKTIAAISLGLFGGFATRAIAATGAFDDALRPRAAPTSCCGARTPYAADPVWRFWTAPDRRAVFRREAMENGLFLLKWLALAYLLESLMVRHIPAEWIGGFLGGDGITPVFLGALIGGPAYLNGYAAVPLLSGLIEQGMSQGAAMAFVIAGGVSCIPAAVAVWALVKPRVFAAYIGLAFIGALLAGLIWGAVV